MSYKQGKIYVIENKKTNKKYIGSTCFSLKKRFQEHIYASVSHIANLYTDMRKNDKIDFTITLIERWPCDNKQQLNKREGYHQVINNTVKNGLNTIYAYLPEYTTTLRDKIWKAQWYQNNKERTREKQLENSKKWKKNNPEKLKISKAKSDNKYRINNLEKIKNYNKEWREENKETISERRKERRNGVDREKILKAKRENYEKNKSKGQVKVKCEFCESEMTKRSLNRHLKEVCKKIKS